MIAKILISPDLETRVGEIDKILASNSLKKPHPDLLYLDDSEKLGVEQAKKIREFLSLKPYQARSRAIVVESAGNLTQDAQNSLLKTLEEPPEEAIILLGTSSEHSLLPTILSRCELVLITNFQLPISNENLNDKLQKEIDQLINSSVEDRFDFIEKLEDKEVFFKALVEYFHQIMRNSAKSSQTLEFSKKLLAAEEWAKSNGNLRAILEYLMLNLS